MDRRRFLQGALAGAGAAALGGAGVARATDVVNLATLSRPDLVPSATPVKTVVVVSMENRSVDHYLGWYGAENKRFDGTTKAAYRDRREGSSTAGERVETETWGIGGRKDYHGRGFRDPGHSVKSGRVQANGGRMDGWLDEGSATDEFALSYYRPEDIPVWADLVRTFTTYDRYFCSFLGNTQPNRWYLYSGQTGGEIYNTLPPNRIQERPEWAAGYDWPTIWDQLDAAGVSWAFYYSNLPNTAFWGPRYLPKTRHISEYYAAAEAGLLPQVCFVEPWFIAPDGISNDDHPHADLRYGQEFLSDVTGAFAESPQFREGAMFITYDEWGGFWDHVAPPALPDSQDDPSWVDYTPRPEWADFGRGGAPEFGQLGMRVPTVTLSPWSVGGLVDKSTYEHCSITKFIGENWGLPVADLNPLRIGATRSIGQTFDFSRTPVYEVDVVPYDAPLEIRTEAYEERLAAAGLGATGTQFDLYDLADTGWFEGLAVNVDHRFEDSFRRTRVR